jgi:hypothetical protein
MKRFATTTLAAGLLTFGAAYGLQAQEHHRGRDQNDQPQAQQQNDKDHDHDQQQSKNDRKAREEHARQEDQRQRDYQRSYDQRMRDSQRENERLQAQNREAQLRAQREYEDNVRRQREEFDRQRADRDRDRDRDRDDRGRAYGYAPNYSYRIGRSVRMTDRYGAELLQHAVSDGYEQGFEFGLADRRDGRGFGPHHTYGWRDGMYGYGGRYIDRGDYQYYFREGFDRGYEDAFYGSHRYGSIGSNGKAFILGTVLGTILGFSIH